MIHGDWAGPWICSVRICLGWSSLSATSILPPWQGIP
jgi:hypothetical protein